MRRTFGGAFGASAATHAAILVLVVVITSRMPAPSSSQHVTPDETGAIVWMRVPGPGGGGGGGGARVRALPRRAEAPGVDPVTVRPRSKLKSEPAAAARQPEPLVQIDALPTASGITDMPGVVVSPPSSSDSLGPGSLGGAGNGRGGGSGPGDGLGVGEGQDRGTGGNAYRPGTDGVTFPRLVREIPPAYTNGALRARVQGIVELRAVVRADGSVGDVWVTRSLDHSFGLDQEAVRAVQQWRFSPAMRAGQPVTVVVPIELQFTIR